MSHVSESAVLVMHHMNGKISTREFIHRLFMDGWINRDHVAMMIDAAQDELEWIDANFKRDK